MVLVPLAWLGDHVALPHGLTAEALAADLVRIGLEEEAIHTGGEVSGPLVVGRVLERHPEPQSNGKTINWCSVDVGEAGPRGTSSSRCPARCCPGVSPSAPARRTGTSPTG